ncbi:hypothetical protein B0H14DRAFT_2628894 [Mycena olivaceomarginata]|nr:hypothetical protein B0H14DRAFT_2628894 [Mycena olivaceomarginata]
MATTMCGPLGLTYKSREKPPAPSASCQELEPAASSEYPTPSPLDYFPESILPCSPVIRAEVPVLPESIRADSTVLLDTRVGIPAEQEGMAGGTKAGGESKVWKVGDWRTEARRSNQKEEARPSNHKCIEVGFTSHIVGTKAVHTQVPAPYFARLSYIPLIHRDIPRAGNWHDMAHTVKNTVSTADAAEALAA